MHLIVSDNVTGKFEADGDTGTLSLSGGWRPQMKKAEPEPSPLTIDQSVILNAAQQIASNVVNTTETIGVYLARGGALDNADKFAQGRLWTRDLETLETIPAQTEPKKEAYRLYDIGVANEALGYAAQDKAAAIKYLQQASNDYEKALDLQSGEKFFLEPQQRIIAALKRYEEKPEAAHDLPSKRVAPVGAQSIAVSNSRKAASPDSSASTSPMTDSDVLAMLQAHMDEGNILDNITHAEAVHFDLSVGAQIQLTKAGLDGRELSAMKKRAQAAGTTASTAAKSLR